MLSQRKLEDRLPLKSKTFHDKIFGKLFSNKGCMAKPYLTTLYRWHSYDYQIEKRYENCQMHIQYRILLKKRALIEIVNDKLRNICQIEHSWLRGFENFRTNLLSWLPKISFKRNLFKISMALIEMCSHINIKSVSRFLIIPIQRIAWIPCFLNSNLPVSS